MSTAGWLKLSNDGVYMDLVVQPGASRTRVVGLQGSPPRLKIQIAAPPVDGKANEALVEFLSKLIDQPKRNFEVTRGLSGRKKTVFCRGALASIQSAIEKALA